MTSTRDGCKELPTTADTTQHVGNAIVPRAEGQSFDELARRCQELEISHLFQPSIEHLVETVDGAKRHQSWKNSQYRKLRQRIVRAISQAEAPPVTTFAPSQEDPCSSPPQGTLEPPHDMAIDSLAHDLATLHATLPVPVPTDVLPFVRRTLPWQDGMRASPAMAEPCAAHASTPARPPPRRYRRPHPPAHADLMPWQDGLDHMGDDATYPFFQGEHVIWRPEPDHGCVWVVEADDLENELQVKECDVDANYLVLPWRGSRFVLESDGPDEALRRGECSSTRAAPRLHSCMWCGKHMSYWDYHAGEPCRDCFDSYVAALCPLCGHLKQKWGCSYPEGKCQVFPKGWDWDKGVPPGEDWEHIWYPYMADPRVD